MKRFFVLGLALIVLPVHAYLIEYKEQYYQMFRTHLYNSPDNALENIYWLEQAVGADFANPLYALCKISTQKEWEKYRYLFMMHLNLKLLEQYLRLGSGYDKQIAYFYNAPWKEQNIESLTIAESCYNTALVYWREAQIWAEKANQRTFQFLFLNELSYWEDERERIKTGRLNYERTITRELDRLKKVRHDFMEMKPTY